MYSSVSPRRKVQGVVRLKELRPVVRLELPVKMKSVDDFFWVSDLNLT